MDLGKNLNLEQFDRLLRAVRSGSLRGEIAQPGPLPGMGGLKLGVHWNCARVPELREVGLFKL